MSKLKIDAALVKSNDLSLDWSQPGMSFRHDPAGYWWVSASEGQWPNYSDEIESIRGEFEGNYSDRRQLLSFIGIELEQSKIRRLLDSCLLADEEYAQGTEAWALHIDPCLPVEIGTGEDTSSEAYS